MHLNPRFPNGDTCQDEVPFYYIIFSIEHPKVSIEKPKVTPSIDDTQNNYYYLLLL